MVEDQENDAELKRIWPFGKFPLLLDGEPVMETDLHHRASAGPSSGPNSGFRMASSAAASVSSTASSTSTSRATCSRRSTTRYGRKAWATLWRGAGRENLHLAYDWLEANLPDSDWAAGETFTLADCAAAPALFYADWVEEIGDERPR